MVGAFYQVAITHNKISLHIRVMNKCFDLLIFYMVLVEVVHVIKVIDPVHMRVTKKYFGIACNDYQLIFWMLLFYCFTYGCSRYAFSNAAVNLKNYFHCFLFKSDDYCFIIL